MASANPRCCMSVAAIMAAMAINTIIDYAVMMVSVSGTSETNVREHWQQETLAMPFWTEPTAAVTALMAVALNTGMVKSWLMTCERVQHDPQLQGM